MSLQDRLFKDLCHVLTPLGARKCGFDDELEPIDQKTSALEFAQKNWMKQAKRVQELEELLRDRDEELDELRHRLATWTYVP